jgi:hypothetical protein
VHGWRRQDHGFAWRAAEAGADQQRSRWRALQVVGQPVSALEATPDLPMGPGIGMTWAIFSGSRQPAPTHYSSCREVVSLLARSPRLEHLRPGCSSCVRAAAQRSGAQSAAAT